MLVLHALTGDAHVTGPAGPGQPTAGWWERMVGPGLPIDTDRWFVVAPNILGGCQGTTGPASLGPALVEWGGRFPYVTIRDQVAAQVAFADALGIPAFAAVVGGSMGGMHALEWAIGFPDRVERVAVLAAPAASSADQIALNSVQTEAVRADPHYRGGDYYDAPDGDGPHRGLALARRMALLNYRSPGELNERFARSWQSGVSPLHPCAFSPTSSSVSGATPIARAIASPDGRSIAWARSRSRTASEAYSGDGVARIGRALISVVDDGTGQRDPDGRGTFAPEPAADMQGELAGDGEVAGSRLGVRALVIA